MNLQTLLDDPPKIHEYNGKRIAWCLHRSVLNFIDSHVNERSTTLETGSGLSTTLFALKGGPHLCITPSQVEVDRIQEYCTRHAISLQRIDFRVDFSENVLPRLGPGELDLALIDGGHGFPVPFLDWYFISSRLKIGGILIIDDIQLWTGRILKEFLLSEPEWKLIEPLADETAVFRKERNYRPSKEWVEQPYVVQRSDDIQGSESKFRKGFRLLRQGRIRVLTGKVAKKIKIRSDR